LNEKDSTRGYCLFRSNDGSHSLDVMVIHDGDEHRQNKQKNSEYSRCLAKQWIKSFASPIG